MNSFGRFLQQESIARDVIGVKRLYIRMAGDIASGVMLSQIVYWFLPNRDGGKKTSIEFEGSDWIAKRLSDWEEECALTPDQARRCLKVLEQRGFIACKLRKFDGSPTTHIRLIPTAILDAHNVASAPNGFGQKPKTDLGSSPNGNGFPAKSINKEETTAETTAESKTLGARAIPGVAHTVNPNARRERTEATEDELLIVFRGFPRQEAELEALPEIAAAVKLLMRGKRMPSMSLPEALEYLSHKTKLYAQSRVGQDERFTPTAARWFKGGRYLEDPNKWSSNASDQRNAGVRESAATQRQRESRDAIGSAGKRRYGFGTAGADGADAGEISEPNDPGGYGGYVPGAVGRDGGEVWSGGVPGRTVEAVR